MSATSISRHKRSHRIFDGKCSEVTLDRKTYPSKDRSAQMGLDESMAIVTPNSLRAYRTGQLGGNDPNEHTVGDWQSPEWCKQRLLCTRRSAASHRDGFEHRPFAVDDSDSIFGVLSFPMNEVTSFRKCTFSCRTGIWPLLALAACGQQCMKIVQWKVQSSL